MRNEQGNADGNVISTVVIIIGILVVVAAIFFPIYQRTFQRTDHYGNRKPSCQNNLKELGISIALYYGDFDATLPSSILYGGSKTWKSSDFMYFAGKEGTLPPPAATATHPTWPMLLYSYMKNKDIVWCPSDLDRREDENAVVSYYWKAAIDRAWYGDAKVKPSRKEGDFDFPADQIIMYERAGWHWGDADKGFADGVTINCLFLDGHVSSRRIANSGYGASENPPTPLPKSGVGEPAWFNYDFMTPGAKSVKGQHWDPKVWGDSLP